jgi:exonuclease SbcC
MVQWRSFEDCKLEFPLGLIGVVGPNGAGKTTLAEAIGWALFGKLRPGSKLDDVRRQGADGERSLVKLVFRIGDTIYAVERVVKGSAKLWIGDPGDLETETVGATNARIIRELDMTWETFQRTVFARQKDVAALDPSVGTDARRRHVERLLGLERYRYAAEKARARVRELDAELRGMREGAPDVDALREERDAAAKAAGAADPDVLDAEAALKAGKATLEDLEQQLEEARVTARRHEKLTETRDRAATKMEEERTRLDALRRKAGDRADNAKQLAALDGRGDDIDALAAARDAWDDVAERQKALAAVQGEKPATEFHAEAAAGRSTRLDALRVELVALHRAPPPSTDGLAERIKALELAARVTPLSDARTRLREIETQREECQDAISRLRAQIEQDKEHLREIEVAGPDAECWVCLRPFGGAIGQILEDHRTRLEHGGAALAEHGQRLQDLDRDRGEAERACKAAEQAAEALAHTSGPDDLAAAEAGLAEAEAATRQHAALTQEYDRLAPAVEADVADERETAQYRGRLTECTGQLRAALARVAVDAYDTAAHARAVKAHEDATVLHERTLKLRSEIGAAAGIDAEVTEGEAALRAATTERDDATRDLANLAFDIGREDSLRESLDQASTAKDQAIENLSTARAEAQGHDAQVQKLKRRVEEAEQMHGRIAQRERELREHAAAAEILTAFRTAQNERAWPRLEEGASALLSETTDGRYADVRLSTDYKLVIVDRGEEHGLERYSGGEQDLANLCLRLAIADWVARERGVELGFVVLDEVFGSQDEERRRRLADELRTLGNRFHQLLVITHVPDIAELGEHQISVQLDEPGRSTAELTSG